MLPFINTFTICVCVYTVNANKKIVCTEVSSYLITLNKVGVSKLNTFQGDILNEIQEIFWRIAVMLGVQVPANDN